MKPVTYGGAGYWVTTLYTSLREKKRTLTEARELATAAILAGHEGVRITRDKDGKAMPLPVVKRKRKK